MEEKQMKIAMCGEINFSFGKNGMGLTNEITEIGKVIEKLGKDNHVYLKESSIDTCDDVYDLKFTITPHKDNEWMLKENYGNDKQ